MTSSSVPDADPAGQDGDVRQRIFESALRRFSEKGYAATSLREVSTDARTTKPMIYYYFGSKEGLYSSIVRQILEEMAMAIQGDFPADAPPRDRVIAFCERYLDHFLRKEETIALVLREVFGLGGALDTFTATLGDDVRAMLDRTLEEGMASGAFRQDNMRRCATAITGILNMFILAHVFGHAPFDREAPLGQVHYYLDGLCLQR